MNKTKKLLIDITFELLYKKGYCATSITDILKIAELTKGALYYHFLTKDTLVLATMEHYIEEFVNSHWVNPIQDSQNPIEAIITQINSHYALYEDKESIFDVKHGCPLNNFIMDMSDKNEEFFKYLESAYKRWQESIEKALTKAQILKQTKTEFDAKEQAMFIISTIEGSICSAKAYNNLETLNSNYKNLIKYISSL